MGKKKDLFKNPFEKKAGKPKVASDKELKKLNAEANEKAQSAPSFSPQDVNVVKEGRPHVDNLFNCPECKGSGLADKENPQSKVCTNCNGTGRV